MISAYIGIDQWYNHYYDPQDEYLKKVMKDQVMLIGYNTFNYVNKHDCKELIILSESHYTQLINDPYLAAFTIKHPSELYALYERHLMLDKEIVLLGGIRLLKTFLPVISKVYLSVSWSKAEQETKNNIQSLLKAIYGTRDTLTMYYDPHKIFEEDETNGDLL